MAKDIDALLEQQADQMTSVLKSHAAHIENMLAQHRFQVAQLALHNPEPFVHEVFNHLRDRWYKSPSMKLALLMLRMRVTCCEYLIAWNCQH
ncbi:hypothetical protein [Klebsiella quasipneumoniae]|uniref:hypothetical protein n=1 Tax=Klebsiella quasipneumoniae TaxID=1463165 RepID=UPI0038908C39